MTITPTKIVAFDTKINYRLVQFFNFFSQKIAYNLTFVDTYYVEIINVVNSSTGHSKTHYQLFIQFKLSVNNVVLSTTEYLNVNPPLEEEAVYLLKVKNTLKILLCSFSQYIHNFGKLWYREKITLYNNDYTIVETDEIIESTSIQMGIINIMNPRQIFILYTILTIITRIMEQTNNYFISLFQKLDKNNENIQQITLVLFPKLFLEYEAVIYFLFFSGIDFNIIFNNRENILEMNVNKNFTNKIKATTTKILELNQTIQTIFSLI